MLLMTRLPATEEDVMSAPDRQDGSVHGPERFQGLSGLVIGVVMLLGRGSLSRLVADLAGVRPGRPGS